MRLDELFADTIDVAEELRQAILDVLVPMAGSGVPYVGIDQVVEKLSQMKSGLRVDRALVLDLLDPQEVPLVKNITGDRIEFTAPSPIDDAKAEKEAMKSQKKVQDMAKKQVSKELKKPDLPKPNLKNNSGPLGR